MGGRWLAAPGVQLPGHWPRAAQALAQTSGCPLLGLLGSRDGHGLWRFSHADAQADLRPGGPAMLQALALALDATATPGRPAFTQDRSTQARSTHPETTP